MDQLRITRSSAVAILSLLILTSAACQKKEEQAAANQPAPAAAAPAQPSANAPAAAAPAPAPTNALGSAQYSADPAVRCDLLEVKRTSGGALTIRWRVVNSGQNKVYYDFAWTDLYYTDPAENKKYGFLTDSEGNRILDVHWGNLTPGEQRANWAKFPAPPAGSTKVTVYIPRFAPFEDVPVTP